MTIFYTDIISNRNYATNLILDPYLKSAEWRTKAEAAKAAAGNRCQVCNKSRAQVQLDAHHRTYERLGNELPEDITVLCRDCHQLYEDGKIASRPKTTPRRKPPKSNKKRNSSAKGFCVRCRKSVKLNPQSPYCYTCFKSWNRYANLEYKEKYCHACGQDHDSTMAKPVCYSCYKKYKSSLKFSFNTNVMKS